MKIYPVGSLVKFRSREWVVVPSGDEELLRLRPLTGRNDEECGAFLPLEGGNIFPAEFPLPNEHDLGDFYSSRLLWDAARLLLRYGAGPLRCMGHLSFRPKPYQLVPLIMALRMSIVRLMIADDVGIGKTIEAGLIAREMIDRNEIKRFAVVCPPYLCYQWQKELAEKFDIKAEVVRSDTFGKLERTLPGNQSIFQHYPYTVISVDFIKSARNSALFLPHCPDLVIVDEAHGCARPAGASPGQQQRHELIRNIAGKVDRHLVLVTATPHSGKEESFLSLLGMLKPSYEQFNMDELDDAQRKLLATQFIQRTRKDVKRWANTDTQFPDRESTEAPYTQSEDYRKLFDQVNEFARGLVAAGDGTGNVARYWAALALLRCVMSSPAAASAALRGRLSRLAEAAGEEDYRRYIMDPLDEEDSTDELPSNALEDAEVNLADKKKSELRRFARLADELAGEKDFKLKDLSARVLKLLKEGFSPIVFCRYIATAEYVAVELKKRLETEYREINVSSVTGQLTEEERDVKVKEISQFQGKKVLVATDCLSEGINLHTGFDAVIHYDLPWNPNRLEQREGRVDRFGQISKVVKAVLMIGTDNVIDGKVLEVLLYKARQIHKDIGISVPVPRNSESVMKAVFNAIFAFKGDPRQLRLFETGDFAQIHRDWDKAAEREKKIRSIFAQHSIKEDEIISEIKESDAVLGDAATVESFTVEACNRLQGSIERVNGHYRLDPANLPFNIKQESDLEKAIKIAFNQPLPPHVVYVSRIHSLTRSLAEHLFSIAFDEDGDRLNAARCAVFRSAAVDKITTVLILRFRFLVTNSASKAISMAEECLTAGFRGLPGSETWLSNSEAKDVFNSAKVDADISATEKKDWLRKVMGDPGLIKSKTGQMAEERATSLSQSYDNIRKLVKGSRETVKPLLPVDILAIHVLVPKPKM